MENHGKLKKNKSSSKCGYGSSNMTLQELVALRRQRTLKREEMLSQARMDMELAINNAKRFSLPNSVSSLCAVEKQAVPRRCRAATLPVYVGNYYGTIDTDSWNDHDPHLDVELYKTRFDKDLINSDEKQDNVEFCGNEIRETSEIEPSQNNKVTSNVENALPAIIITKSEEITTTSYIRNVDVKKSFKSNNVSMESTNVTVCKGKSVIKQSTLPEIKTPSLFHNRRKSVPIMNSSNIEYNTNSGPVILDRLDDDYFRKENSENTFWRSAVGKDAAVREATLRKIRLRVL